MQLKSENHSRLVTVGLTGGIGSGKTIVSHLFSLIGIPVYNADDRARYLQTNDKTIINEIKSLFGEKSYEDGVLNRAWIAQQVFGDKSKLEKLNAIVHPRVKDDFSDWLGKKNDPYIIKEAAIFFEAGTYKEMDKMITVYAPEELRVHRVLNRDTFRTDEDIKSIMAKQLSDEEKMRRSDFVIYNDDKQMVIPQVIEIDRRIRESI